MARNRNRLLLSTAFTVALLSTIGCRGFQGFFTPPGPLNKQQASAVVHDPYPQNDIGPYDAASRPPKLPATASGACAKSTHSRRDALARSLN